jgi:hypothetical protein
MGEWPHAASVPAMNAAQRPTRRADACRVPAITARIRATVANSCGRLPRAAQSIGCNSRRDDASCGMSWNTGGLIFKAHDTLDVPAMLNALAIREDEVEHDPSFESATSSRYRGIGMYTKARTAWLFGFLGLSAGCAFEAELTETEQQLAALSQAGDVLLFHLHGHSGTYGWALFQRGARACVRLYAPTSDDPVEFSDGVAPVGFDQPANEDGIFELLGDFGGMSMYDLYEHSTRHRDD